MKASPFLAIAERLNKLDESQQKAFRKKLAEQGINSWQLPIVASQQQQYPLSVAQLRFLVAEHMSGDAIYNLCSVIKFDQQLNPVALETAINQLIQRHQVMTTCFKQNEQGQWYPEQLVDYKIALPVETVELNDDETEKTWLNRQFLQQQNHQFDLTSQAPFTGKLFSNGQDYWLFVTIHHVAFDGWSFNVFNQELAQLYQAEASQQTASLPELTIQHQDYAYWQNQWLQSDDYLAQQTYWQQQLADLPEPIALPLDKPDNIKHREFTGETRSLILNTELSNQLRQQINQQGHTLYIYLQTAFSWLLAKYSDQYDFCFGSSIANRKREELASMVGPLLNTLVIRHKLNYQQSFTDSLANCQATVGAAFDHQDYPFEQLNQLLEQNKQNSALFKVMFIHVGLANHEQVTLGQSKGEVVTPDQNSARFDLSLRVIEKTNQEISLDLEFSDELFTVDTIEQLLNDFTAIIVASLANPAITLADVQLASKPSSLSGEPLKAPLQPLLTTLVAHPPESIALFDGEQTINYQALNQHIEKFAAWLQHQGIQISQTVAIAMPRQVSQIALMLACWRIGAVCLMLDPRQPAERLNGLIQDANASLLVCDNDYQLSISNSYVVPKSTNYWSDFISSTGTVDKAITQPQVALDDPAYILYTSGSTGKPKGIVVSHRAISHYAAAISQQYPHPENTRWLTLATVAADLGLTSVFAALYQGQCLLLPEHELTFDPNALSEFLTQHPADCLKITPSHLQALLNVENPQSILPKQSLFLGGEGLTKSLVKQLSELAPALNIINHYGPSEATVGIASQHITNNTNIFNENSLSPALPLGQPLPGNHISLRDRQGNLVPQGVIAELCVASPQLASGYWNNQQQTNAAFIQERSNTDADATYYKTGDLARINKQGQLEFIGRADDQIKRCGYRLELGEISAWLAAQTQVENAIVLMREFEQRQQLIAWLQLKQPENEQVLAELQSDMSKALPEYMQPDQWVNLAALPLNHNGKIDRNALPAPSIKKLEDNNEQRALTDKEQILASIWQQLLAIESVRPSDNFFNLGGDSIMSLQMIGLASKQGLKLAPAKVAELGSLAKIAESAQELLSANANKLLGLFSKVLQRENVTADENFYQAGGDSILSLQLIALAKQQGIQLTPKLLADYPTVKQLAQYMEQVDNGKDSEPKVQNKAPQAESSNLPSVDIAKPHPLSLAQQRIWFIQQLDPQSTAYNLPATFNVSGQINQTALLKACQQLVEQHIVLRVKYFEQNGTPYQQVTNGYQPLTIHPAVSLEIAETQAKQLANRCFELASGQVISLDLIPIDLIPINKQNNTTDTNNYLFVFNIHHIATDGWSMGLLIQELLNAYQSNQASTALNIEPVSSALSHDKNNYLDWAAWQQAQGVANQDKNYWLARLADMPHQLNLTTDKPWPAQQSYQGSALEWQLPNDVVDAIDSYAQQLKTTPFNVLLAGFQLLMWRYSGQTDFAIGVPVSGRQQAVSQNMIGVFINTLINRVAIKPELNVDEWLNQYIQALQQDFDHQQMPLEQLLHLLNPARDLTRPAVFQVMFNYQNDQQKQRVLTLPDVTFSPLETEKDNTKFELSFNLLRREQIELQIEYNTDLFEADTIAQMFADYQAILAWLPNAKQQSLSQLALPSMQQALTLANPDKQISEVTAQDDFIVRFEQQVAKTPNATAIIDNQQVYSYQALNQRANQLAHWLQQQDVKSEQLVAFCLPRNAQMLIAMLAIQKAGAGYLPLDIKQPEARLQYIVEHAKATLCLTNNVTAKVFSSENIKCLNIDQFSDNLMSLPTDNLAATTTSEQLAYTLYTSGSTGKPKGVEIERGNFAGFLQAIERQLSDYQTLLALTTITFDIAGLELCLPLVHGKTIVIADEEHQRDDQLLGQLIQRHNIDLIQATPATWTMLCQRNSHILTNTHAVCGGEALSHKLAQQLLAACKTVTNVYGPTEATVWSSAVKLSADSADNNTLKSDKSHTPIGRAIAHNHFYVLDQQQQSTPRGVTGELYIAGNSLARGYRHAPELTAKAFIEHPQLGRLYRTGDQVKWLKSNQLSFIGRCDFQIKHRGYRIEPGEIESILLKKNSIEQAVVTLIDEKLVAYLVTSHPIDNQSLHQELASLLPDYMIPQHVVSLAEFPLNSNGKVDRHALPKPQQTQTSEQASTELVSLTAQEQTLASIWQGLLDIEQIQPEDNFFLLGGHSLLATQLKAKLNEQGLNLPLKVLFEAPTLAQQAKLLSTRKYQKITPFAQNNDSALAQARIPLSDAQKRLWFMQQMDENNSSFNMQTVVKINGVIDANVLQQAVNQVSDLQPIVKTLYLNDNGEPYQVVSTDLAIKLNCIAVDNETQLKQHIEQAANTAFDLATEAPLRIYLYQLAQQQFVFQLVQHHIATDAWSMTLLLDQLMQAYQDCVQQTKTLVVPEVTYLDYAHWQNTPQIKAQQAESLTYWRQTLAGVPSVQPLKLDNNRPEKAQNSGDIVNITLNKTLVDRLNNLAQQEQSSLFMLLLSVYGAFVHQQSRCQDMIIGADIANREHLQTQDMLGFFVNLLPLRLQPKATMRFADFLQQVKQHSLSSFEHQSVPFEQIVEAVKPERVAGMHPLIQLLFVMQNTPDSKKYSDEFTITPYETAQHHAKFDCALFANEVNATGELTLSWVYNTALFDKATIKNFSQLFISILNRIVEQPQTPLNALVQDKETTKLMSVSTNRPNKRNKLNKLNKLKKTTTKDSAPQVVAATLTHERPFPLLVECKNKSLDALSWARENQLQIMQWLGSHGGIVFRGFNLPTELEFEQFCLAIYPELYAMYGDLPKNDIGKKIYKSTPYPNDQMIMFHNESSHQHRWPRRQWFYCSQPSPVGGATPIVDCREMYQRLPTDIKQKLEEKQLCYIRNFTGLDVSWQHFFKTEQREKVETVCRNNNIQFEWFDTDSLRISQICPAVITHPITAEKSFFNQIQLHHFSFLEDDIRRHFLEVAGEDKLPRNVCYGDGTPLEQNIIDLISELYEACAVRFDWQKSDVVMLDNMLAAHARDPFEGTRKIAVAMGDIYQAADNNTAPPKQVTSKSTLNSELIANTTEQNKELA